MKFMKLSALAAALVATSVVASNAALANDAVPNFDYVSGSYEYTDVEGEGLNGFGAEFSKSLNSDWFMIASTSYVKDSNVAGSGIDLDATTVSVGAGYKFYQADATAVYAGLGLVYVDLNASGFGTSIGDSDTGYGVTLGVRHRFTPMFELDAQVQHVDVADDSDQQFSFTGKYFFKPEWSARANYTFVDSDNSSFGVGISYHF